MLQKLSLRETIRSLRGLLSPADREKSLRAHLEELKRRTPVPVFWLFGKTQSGKTSVVKYLTGADAAEIGEGYRPCTRFSRLYEFPSAETPLLKFLDTRGLDEPGYDPTEDLARFNDQAHVVIVTVKALDHAQENVLNHLRTVRRSKPGRPVLLALTTLHEAYPQQQHPPYPFGTATGEASAPVVGEKPIPVAAKSAANDYGLSTFDLAMAELPSEGLRRSLAEQRRRFEGLVDAVVPIDLTRPEEGYAEPNYGGERLKEVLLAMLPGAFRQTLMTIELATHELRDLHARHALPFIVGYSALAATAGAIPVPFVDLVLLPGVQARMINDLAKLYGQPLSARRFIEIASSLGIGMLARQAARELVKVVPFFGAVAGAALAGASTFALGKAFCYYLGSVHQGQVPDLADLKRYYHEQLAKAEQAWRHKGQPVGGGQG
jgi:uncharacterized protein (DUF697 family)